MAYSNFTLIELEEKFGITNKVQNLFSATQSVEPSELLINYLNRPSGIVLRTEKAKSEWIVVPILNELTTKNESFLSVFSGESLEVNKELGLNGECDFILAQNRETYSISHPILQIVEAKKGDIDLGIPQCAAQMYGAKLYNEKRKTPLKTIYGCVTNSKEWVFMKFENKVITIDKKSYYTNNLSELLGVFQHIINYYKQELKD